VSAVKDVGKFRKALLEERERVVGAIEYMHEENPGSIHEENGEEPSVSENHMADNATDTVDREIDSTLEENSEQVLAEIDAALERIEAGTYGTCEACGKPIGEERLEALPWARLCIDDARKRGR
jgi:RNA polymerase-binding protein DksA